jgi:hypothetical protein
MVLAKDMMQALISYASNKEEKKITLADLLHVI